MEPREPKSHGVAISEVGILRFRRRLTATSELELPYEDVRRAAGACLPLLLSEALVDGGGSDASRLEVSSRPWMPKVTVEPEVSSTARARSGAVGHIHWHAIWHRRLFPEMEADIFVRPIGPQRARLVLDATYRPPGGLPGVVGDLLAGRLIARSTLATFMARLTRTMERAARDGRCGADLGAGIREEAV